MSDGFDVDVESVRQAARTFDSEKQLPGQLGTEVQSAGTVDTGDISLNTQLRSFADEVNSALTTLGQLINSDAIRLDATATGYESTDEAIAQNFNGLNDGGASAPTA
jgi:type VII secretion effector (TIGR04197 family)